MPFLGSTATIFRGQKQGDLYLQDMSHALPKLNRPKYKRIATECTTRWFSFLYIESSRNGEDEDWRPVNPALVIFLLVRDYGHFLFPLPIPLLAPVTWAIVNINPGPNIVPAPMAQVYPGRRVDLYHAMKAGYSGDSIYYHQHKDRGRDHAGITDRRKDGAASKAVMTAVSFGPQAQLYRRTAEWP